MFAQRRRARGIKARKRDLPSGLCVFASLRETFFPCYCVESRGHRSATGNSTAANGISERSRNTLAAAQRRSAEQEGLFEFFRRVRRAAARVLPDSGRTNVSCPSCLFELLRSFRAWQLLPSLLYLLHIHAVVGESHSSDFSTSILSRSRAWSHCSEMRSR
jgi:hypothetical protein